MNDKLKNSVKNFLRRAEAAGATGSKADEAEIDEINIKLGGIIPGWYIDLITNFPLCGIEFDWQEYPEEDDFDGRSSVFWSRPCDIWDETHEAYPGIAIFEIGFFNVGCDNDGMGDPYFIDSRDGDDPSVYHVYHESVIDADTKIGDFDAGLAAIRLSDFFDIAIFKVNRSQNNQIQGTQKTAPLISALGMTQCLSD